MIAMHELKKVWSSCTNFIFNSTYLSYGKLSNFVQIFSVIKSLFLELRALKRSNHYLDLYEKQLKVFGMLIKMSAKNLPF